MKCPVCVDKKMKSYVYDLGGSTTLMYCPPYYDEEGEYHSHDMNWHHHQFRCSMGHTWGESWQDPCPNPKCDWGKEAAHEVRVVNQEESPTVVKIDYKLENGSLTTVTTAEDKND